MFKRLKSKAGLLSVHKKCARYRLIYKKGLVGTLSRKGTVVLLFIFLSTQLFVNVSADDWCMYRHDLLRTGVSKSWGPTSASLLWYYETYGPVASSAAVVDNKVYIGSFDGRVYCLDAKNGSLIWYFTTTGPIVSSPAVVDNKVYIGSHDDSMYCIDAHTGSLIWRYETSNWIESSPAVTDNMVFFSGGDGYIYALDSMNGNEIWRFDTGAWTVTPVSISDGRVYAGSSNGNLYCLDMFNGTLYWQYTIGFCMNPAPVVYGENLYVTYAEGGTILKLNRQNQTVLWETSLAGTVFYSSLAVFEDMLFVGTDDNYFYALNSSTGNIIWCFETKSAITSSPAVASNTVYFGSYDYYIYALNIFDGTLRWKFKTNGGIHSSPAIYDGVLYIGSLDSRIYAIADAHSPSANDITIEFAHIDTQRAGLEFTINITIYDSDGNLMSNYSDWCSLQDTTGTIQPTDIKFSNGTWNGYVKITKSAEKVCIKAKVLNTIGVSNEFEVLPGLLDGFYIEPVDMIVNDVPFVLTVFAKDRYNNTIVDFNDEVNVFTSSGTISPSKLYLRNGVFRNYVKISGAANPVIINVFYRTGMDVVFVIDNSGSTSDDADDDGISEFEHIRAYIRDFITKLSNKDRAALYAFGPVPNIWPGETPWRYMNFTHLDDTGKTNFLDVLNALVAEYNTPIWDTIGNAIEYCLKYSVQQSMIIALTDGCDFGADWYERPDDNLFPGFPGNGIGFERGSEVYAPWHEWGVWKHYTTHYGEYFVDPLDAENNIAFINAPIEDLDDWNYECTYNFSIPDTEDYANGTRKGLLSADILIYTIGIGLPHHTPYLENTTEYDLYRIASTSSVRLEDGSIEYGKYFYMPSATQLNADTILSTIPYNHYGSSNFITVVDRFVFNFIDTQRAGVPFQITIQAVDKNQTTVGAFEYSVSLKDVTNTLIPTATSDFKNGSWSDWVVITKSASTNAIDVYFNGVHKGRSNEFTVSPLEVARIEVFPDEKIINLENTLQFSAVGYDRYDNPIAITPIWSVESGSISETGLYTPSECGNFTVYATFGDVIGSAVVTVIPPVLYRIEIIPESAIIYTTQTQQFSAQGFDIYNNSVRINPTWYASGGNITQDGLYTPDCEGRFYVYAEDSGVIGSASITVIYIRVEVTADTYTITADDTLQFYATAYDGDNNEIAIEPVWSATSGYINETGFYEPTTTGSICISATDTNTGASGWTTIEVLPGELTTISVFPAIVNVTEGLSTQFIAKGYDAYGNLVDIQPVWSVSGGGSITQTGYFTASQQGMWLVLAEVDDIVGNAIVNVVPVARLEISPQDAEIIIGEALQFSVKGYDENNMEVPVQVSWSVNGGGSISGSGLFVSSEIGHWTVCAEQSGTVGYANVSVIPENGLYQIVITPSEITVTTDQTVQFTATGYAGDGKEVEVLPQWAVNGGGCIDENGVFIPTTVGSWIVYANSSGISANATVIVLPGSVAQIVVTPLNVTMTALESIQFCAEGYDRYGNFIVLSPSWYADAGLITDTGFYTATAAGVWTVSAYQDGVYGFATVTVIAGDLSYIEIIPSCAVVEVNSTFEFHALCYDAAGNLIDVSVSWCVEPQMYGTITDGIFNANLIIGNCTVVAYHANISGSAQVQIIVPQVQINMENAEPPIFDLGLVQNDITLSALHTTAGSTLNISASIHNYGDTVISLWHGNTPTYYNGEWVEYDFYMQSTIITDIVIKCGDYDAPVPVDVWLDGGLIARFDVPDGWHIVVLSNVYITAGNHTLRINLICGEAPRDLSIDWLLINNIRIEAEDYVRYGGSDVNITYRGVDQIWPSDFLIQISARTPDMYENSTPQIILESYATDINFVNPYETRHYIRNNDITYVHASVQFVVSGTYEICVHVDATNHIVEIDEHNNIALVCMNVTHSTLYTLQISPSDVTINAGEYVQFIATGYDAYGNLVPVSVSWTANSGSIDNNGLYTNTVTGNYIICAYTNNISASAAVTVIPAEVTSIVISPVNATINAGEYIQFSAVCFDRYGNEISVSVNWYASNGTITLLGLYTNIYAGTHIIYASYSNITVSTYILVMPSELAYIIVTPSSVTIQAGDTTQFDAQCFDEYGNEIVFSGTWYASNGTIDQAGYYTNIYAGVHTVYAYSLNVSARATVTVVPNALSTILVLPSDITAQAGDYIQFSAHGFDEYGNEINIVPSWYATSGLIDNTGLYMGIQTGTHTIYAELENITGCAIVTIVAGNLVRIEIQPSNITITADDEIQFNATGYDDFNNTITIQPQWYADNGIISQTGFYSATAVGIWNIYATCQNVTGSAMVEVVHGALVRIEVQPSDITITADDTIQFVAAGFDYDNNSFSIHPTWHAENGIINQTGFYIATSTGTWLVHASVGYITGYATVTVVHGVLSQITITPSSINITADDTVQFSATGFDADGNMINIMPRWYATGGIIYQTGLYIAVQTGIWQVSATLNNITGYATVTVVHGMLVTISVTPAQITINADEYVDFNATGYDADNNEFEIIPYWYASTGIITQTGLYQPTVAGTHQIYAFVVSHNITGSATVTVVPGAPVQVYTQPADVTVYVGDTVQFRAIAFDAHNNTVNTIFYWRATGGTITQTGFYTATTAGAYIITATECTTNLTATSTITVLPVLNYLEYALWANSTTISRTIKLKGSDNTIYGNVHTNNEMHISGSDNTVYGDVEYVSSIFNGGSNNNFNATRVMPMAPPVTINIDDYKPTGVYGLLAQSMGMYHYFDTDLRVSAANTNTTLAGLYYVKGDVHISGSNIAHTFTVIAEGNVHIRGSNILQSAFINNISVYTKKDLKISGSDINAEGILYSECKTDISGSDIIITGFVYGNTVKLTCSDVIIAAFARSDCVASAETQDDDESTETCPENMPVGDIRVSYGYDILDDEYVKLTLHARAVQLWDEIQLVVKADDTDVKLLCLQQSEKDGEDFVTESTEILMNTAHQYVCEIRAQAVNTEPVPVWLEIEFLKLKATVYVNLDIKSVPYKLELSSILKMMLDASRYVKFEFVESTSKNDLQKFDFEFVIENNVFYSRKVIYEYPSDGTYAVKLRLKNCNGNLTEVAKKVEVSSSYTDVYRTAYFAVILDGDVDIIISDRTGNRIVHTDYNFLNSIPDSYAIQTTGARIYLFNTTIPRYTINGCTYHLKFIKPISTNTIQTLVVESISSTNSEDIIELDTAWKTLTITVEKSKKVQIELGILDMNSNTYNEIHKSASEVIDRKVYEFTSESKRDEDNENDESDVNEPPAVLADTNKDEQNKYNLQNTQPPQPVIVYDIPKYEHNTAFLQILLCTGIILVVCGTTLVLLGYRKNKM